MRCPCPRQSGHIIGQFGLIAANASRHLWWAAISIAMAKAEERRCLCSHLVTYLILLSSERGLPTAFRCEKLVSRAHCETSLGSPRPSASAASAC